MAYNVAPLNRLVEQFEKLPGIGKKTAQRLAFYVLSLPEESAKRFADAITDAQDKIKKCKVCLNFTDGDVCSVCASSGRDKSTICVVESPKDVLAFERLGDYHGQYHVLHGLISPMDGIGPDQIYLKELLKRVADNDITEVIMATNPTVEGEATAMYIAKLLKPFEIKVTRLAYGLPVGGSLEYADEITLNKALEGRSEIL